MNKLKEIVRYGNRTNLANYDFSRDIETLGREFTQPIDSNRIRNSTETYCLYIELIRVTQGPTEAIKRIEQDLADGLYYRIYMLTGATVYRRENRFEEELHFLRNIYEKRKLDSYVAQHYAGSLLSNNFPEDAAVTLIQSLDKTSPAETVRHLELIANTCQWNMLQEGLKCIADIFRQSGSIMDPKLLTTLEERLRQSSTEKKNNVPLISISLERDVRKRELQRKLYSFCGLQIEFINGILGSALPLSITKFICPVGFAGGAPKGAIGCALSHIKAWEFIVERNYEYAVILEDDGAPFYGFNPEALINEAGKDFDVLMINKRMSSLNSPLNYKYSGNVKVSERLLQIPDTQKGWGGDGYILSCDGAKNLLHCISLDGIIGHIDGQMPSYGYDDQIVAQSHAQRVATGVLKKSKVKERLDVKCLNLPAVHQMNFGFSSIGEENAK